MILAFVAQVRPERLAEYKALHAAPWPEHMAVLTAAHIEDYTIHLDEPRALLFARFTTLATASTPTWPASTPTRSRARGTRSRASAC